MKRTQLNICTDLWQQAEADNNHIQLIIMEDETWVYGYDVEPQQQSLKWKSKSSSRLKKSVTEQIKSEDNAHCFFRQSRFGALRVCS
jgi:hypothetical protein